MPSPLRHNRHGDIVLYRGWGPESCEQITEVPYRFFEGIHRKLHLASVLAVRNAATTSSRLCSTGDHIPTSNLELNIDKNMSHLGFF